MAFQFLCPQGHLLQSDESQVGRPCQCPYCGGVFLVPQVHPGPLADPTAMGLPGWGDAPGAIHEGPARALEETDPDPEVELPAIYAGGASALPAVVAAWMPPGAQQDVVHISCPLGHILETPLKMIGEDAMCPFCQAEFRLRYEDSLEYKQARAEQIERREARLGETWLRWSIAIATAVLVALAFLVAYAMTK